MNSGSIQWVAPQWNLAAVRVVSTMRGGGASGGQYASLNLASHVGDLDQCVLENRRLLQVAAELPAEPLWLQQVHGVGVVQHEMVSGTPEADAVVTFEAGRVCAVMTADCLPVVLVDRHGSRLAVAHAGWRGLSAGVLTATVHALRCDPRELQAWLGPAISRQAFEVGGDVREGFVSRARGFEQGFELNDRGRYQADLYALARIELEAIGLQAVTGGSWCTATQRDCFFSYRRDGQCGRMATVAWLT